MADPEVRELEPQGHTAGESMRITLKIVALVLVVFGCIWFLQGVGVLPGSFMSGQVQWAVYGGIAVAAGISIAARRQLAPR
jgi:hypothetical protein